MFRPRILNYSVTLMSPLSVPNFSPIRARIRVLWRILRSVRNEEVEEDKTKKLKRNFVHSYLGNGWSIFFKFGV